MISDPMTTPVNTRARIAYAFLVALCALIWQFVFFKPNGLIVSLFVLSPLVVWLNRLVPGQAYKWKTASIIENQPAAKPSGSREESLCINR